MGDLVFDDVGCGLQCGVVVDFGDEVFEQCIVLLGVGDFGVELYVVLVFVFVFYYCDWDVVGGIGDGEVWWCFGDVVVVVYLYVEVVVVGVVVQICEQLVLQGDVDFCVVEFVCVGGFGGVVELCGYCLYVIVDVEDWQV